MKTLPNWEELRYSKLARTCRQQVLDAAGDMTATIYTDPHGYPMFASMGHVSIITSAGEGVE